MSYKLKTLIVFDTNSLRSVEEGKVAYSFFAFGRPYQIIEQFYKWSERKEQYKEEQLLSALKWIRENDLVPTGFGKEIKQAKNKNK